MLLLPKYCLNNLFLRIIVCQPLNSEASKRMHLSRINMKDKDDGMRLSRIKMIEKERFMEMLEPLENNSRPVIRTMEKML